MNDSELNIAVKGLAKLPIRRRYVKSCADLSITALDSKRQALAIEIT
jgi:hypothetical protein